jgi:predicted DNA-binding ArsR family transcriptional regulator
MKINVYPKSFEKYNNYMGAVQLSDEEINELIDEGIDLMKKEKMQSSYISTGNTIVFFKINELKNELNIWVCKNYEVMSINYKEVFNDK